MNIYLKTLVAIVLSITPVMISSTEPTIQQENGVSFIQLGADRMWCGSIKLVPLKFPTPVHNPGNPTALKFISERVSSINYFQDVEERYASQYPKGQVLSEVVYEVRQRLGEAYVFQTPGFEPHGNHFGPSGFSQEYQLPVEYRATFGKGSANTPVARALLGWDKNTAYLIESSEYGHRTQRYIEPSGINSHFRIYVKGLEFVQTDEPANVEHVPFQRVLEEFAQRSGLSLSEFGTIYRPSGKWIETDYLPIGEYVSISSRHNVPCWLGPAGPNAPIEPLNMKMFTAE